MDASRGFKPANIFNSARIGLLFLALALLWDRIHSNSVLLGGVEPRGGQQEGLGQGCGLATWP